MLSVLGATKHSSRNQCIETWQQSYIVLYIACVLSTQTAEQGIPGESSQTNINIHRWNQRLSLIKNRATNKNGNTKSWISNNMTCRYCHS